MRLLCLFALAGLVVTASALTCEVGGSSGGTNSFSTQTCASGEVYCSTTTNSDGDVTKACTSSCTAFSSGGTTVECCQTDNCNADTNSGGSGPNSCIVGTSTMGFSSQPCSDSDTACQKNVATVFSFQVITKSCTSSCTPGSSTASGATTAVYCCNTDDCNSGSSVLPNVVGIVLTCVAGALLLL